MWKWISVISVVLLIATNAFWLYSYVDLASILKYRDLENFRMSGAIESLIKISNKAVAGLDQDAANQLLNDIDPTSEPFVKEGAIHGGFISLRFDENGKVTSVEY